MFQPNPCGITYEKKMDYLYMGTSNKNCLLVKGIGIKNPHAKRGDIYYIVLKGITSSKSLLHCLLIPYWL